MLPYEASLREDHLLSTKASAVLKSAENLNSDHMESFRHGTAGRFNHLVAPSKSLEVYLDCGLVAMR